MMRKCILFNILIIFLLPACGPSISTSSQPTPMDVVGSPLSTLELGLSFPPVSDMDQRAFTQKQLEVLNVRLLRFAENWSNREPAPDLFRWQPLDDRLRWVVEKQFSLLLTIQSNGPDWACNSDLQNERSCVYRNEHEFTRYITTLLQRYPNQIEKIQFGNEWTSAYWYVGSAEEFVQFNNILYRAVQQYSPQTEVVLGGISFGTLKALAFCDGALDAYKAYQDHSVIEFGREQCETPKVQRTRQRIAYVLENAHYDWLDFHFYDEVEDWSVILQSTLAALPTQRPVLVSEFGGPNLFLEQPYSDEFQAERLAEYIQTLDEMGIPEAYFFKLVQSDSANPAHRQSGLFKVSADGIIPKPAFFVFEAYSTIEKNGLHE